MSFIKPNTSDSAHDVTFGLTSPTYASSSSSSDNNRPLRRGLLPIHDHRDRILYAVEQYRVVIVMGETGCGKTTQIPQFLYDAGWYTASASSSSASSSSATVLGSGIGASAAANTNASLFVIGCTQPRRVSTVTVAQRVAQERGTAVGDLVGYSIQFDNQCSEERTRIKYMTDGILIREMMVDPLLRRYSVIMIDEAHERSVNTDIILGLLKKILRKRPELRLIVSSATLEADKFRKFFTSSNDANSMQCCVLAIQGSNYPVDVMYLSHPSQNYVKECLETIVTIHKREPLPGDILVFLTGQEEIDTLVEMLVDRVEQERMSFHLLALPMYAGLPVEEQLKVFQPTPRNVRKVIVATNIAETSITIEGITHVIDCGFAKMKIYDPRSHSESLIVAPISKSSATQRAGRAGRVRPGKCYRLYTSDAYRALLPDHTLPEIQCTDLSSVIIQLKALGIDDIAHFDFITRPARNAVERAQDTLQALGALDEHGALTYPLGLHISQFPVSPKQAKLLLVSGDFHCSEEAATIVAMLSVRNVFSTAHNLQKRIDEVKKQFAVLEGDHFTFLNIYSEYQRNRQSSRWCYDNYINHKAMRQVDSIRSQLIKFMKHFGVQIQSITKHPAYKRPITSEAQMRQIKKEEAREARQTRPPTKGGYASDRRSYYSTRQQEPQQQQGQPQPRTTDDNLYISNIKKCIIHGFFENVAQRLPDGQTYEAVGSGEHLRIHPSSTLFHCPPSFVLYGEVVQTMENKFVMRHVLAVDSEMVQSTVPSFYEFKRVKR